MHWLVGTDLLLFLRFVSHDFEFYCIYLGLFTLLIEVLEISFLILIFTVCTPKLLGQGRRQPKLQNCIRWLVDLLIEGYCNDSYNIGYFMC
jgi:hypothetical protein